MQERNNDPTKDAKLLLNFQENHVKQVLDFYNVSEKSCFDMIEHILSWFSKQAHLPKITLEPEWILRHLLTKSFSVEATKQKIDNYYAARRKMPELLKNRDPLCQTLSQYLHQGFWIVLPKKTPENHRVTIFRIKDPECSSVATMVKLVFMIADYRLRNDAVVGDHWILDFQNMNFQHALQMNPMLISKITHYLNSCLNPKLKGLHIVNLPSYAAAILNVFRSTMKTKLLKRVHVYGDVAEAVSKFPKSIIPRDYGGDEVSCDEIAERWTQALQSPFWREWYRIQDGVDTEESQRISKDAAYGTNGTFRKLDID